MYRPEEFGMSKSSLKRYFNAGAFDESVYKPLLEKKNYTIEEIQILSRLLYTEKQQKILENRVNYQPRTIALAMRLFNSYVHVQAQIFVFRCLELIDQENIENQACEVGKQVVVKFPELPIERFDRIAIHARARTNLTEEKKVVWMRGFIQGVRKM
jgi:hypothetical protein